VLQILLGASAAIVWEAESEELSTLQFLPNVPIFTGDSDTIPRPIFEPRPAYFVQFPANPAPPRASFSVPAASKFFFSFTPSSLMRVAASGRALCSSNSALALFLWEDTYACAHDTDPGKVCGI